MCGEGSHLQLQVQLQRGSGETWVGRQVRPAGLHAGKAAVVQPRLYIQDLLGYNPVDLIVTGPLPAGHQSDLMTGTPCGTLALGQARSITKPTTRRRRRSVSGRSSSRVTWRHRIKGPRMDSSLRARPGFVLGRWLAFEWRFSGIRTCRRGSHFIAMRTPEHSDKTEQSGRNSGQTPNRAAVP